ncbi:MAG: helix-turn-helix domain-containing protein, partial [Hyphomonadaceae bacterium]
MSDDDSRLLYFRLFTEIGIINQLSSNRLERELPDGMSLAQFGVLNHFVRLGGQWAPTRLARAFQVTKGAMTNTLQRLEAQGLVKVVPDPKDARAKLV